MPVMFAMSVRYAKSASSEGECLIQSLSTRWLKLFLSDVMARHTAIHEQESTAKKPRKVSWLILLPSGEFPLLI